MKREENILLSPKGEYQWLKAIGSLFYSMEKITKSTSETQKLASALAKQLKTPAILALYGDLGSGKTTFVQGLAKGLGITQRILSPTFLLQRIYKYESGKELHHLDLYRLTAAAEAESLALKELFNEENVLIVIEWPEIIENFLPPQTVKIHFTHLTGDERKITLPATPEI
jgi:tRNA threonylcarbamoyladenosine biosynthesis protein TsaE